MRIGTIVSLGASAALGIGALMVARIWLPAPSAHAGAHPTAEAPGVPVVLAAAEIPYGTKLDAKQLTVLRLPADAAPPGAFSTVQQVLRQDAGGAPVALVAMSPREPILATKVSGPGARPTLASLIGDGMRAYTIGVTEVAGGGGHVMPGDRVDVVLTRNVSTASASPGGQQGKLVSELVIQNVRVLGMDLNIDPTSAHPAVAHTATLEVSVEDAERLSLAAQAGAMSLALRRTGAAEVKDVRPMLTSDLGPGVGTGRKPAPRHHAADIAGGSSVTIVHGEHRDSVAVPVERFGAGV